ncbi:mast cell carboxypeptidase A-like [Gastrophryne carolinensis]
MKLLLLLPCFVASMSVLHPRRFDNEKLFRVFLHNEMEVSLIKKMDEKMNLDFWKPKSSHHIIPKSRVYFHANAEQSEIISELLNKNGIQYKIVFHNLQETVENQFRKQTKYQKGMIRYHTWKEIAFWAYTISIKYPSMASLITIGKTFEGNPMHILKIGNASSAKKGVFVECGAHAREWISPAFCQWFVNEAMQKYGKDKEITNLLDNIIFHVLPVFNVDGYIWTWTGDRMWRKNRAPTPQDKCFGIDLNRNFDASWNGSCADYPCSDIYCGTEPESEPETKAITTYIRENLSDLKAYICVHAFSQLLMYPYGYKEDPAPDDKELENIAKAAVDNLKSLYNTSYGYGSIASTLYTAYGSSVDWAYDKGIRYSFAFELRDEGDYGFLLPEHDIEPTCKETMLAVKTIASYVINLKS